LANSAHYFYPERSHIFAEMRKLAISFGGDLPLAPLPWKYAWIQRCFGWDAAKRARVALPEMRGRLRRKLDCVLHRLEGNMGSKSLPMQQASVTGEPR